MNNLLTTFIVCFFSLYSFGQNIFPIKTKLKGESVIIYTLQQYKDIDLTIQNQRDLTANYKNKTELYLKKIDSLESLLKVQSKIIDSLSLSQIKTDSLEKSLKSIEEWFVESSIDNAYIYMSWQDNKIKYVDLTLYTVHCNLQTGTIRMVRRDTNDKYYSWKNLNHKRKESPSLNWEDKYPLEDRPIVKVLPLDIKINEHLE